MAASKAPAKKVVAVGSKPTLVDALAAQWRASAEHTAEQIGRFIRLTVIAAIPALVNLFAGGKFDWKTLLAFILPIAEVTYRQVWPALSAVNADSAPGVTIVPDQLPGGAVNDEGYAYNGLLVTIVVAAAVAIIVFALLSH